MATFSRSSLSRTIRPSATLAVAAKARELRSAGRTVYDLSAGEPDAPPPAAVRRAVAEKVRSGPMRYAPVAGLPELREAAAADLSAFHGRTVAPSEVAVTCGAKQALANLFRVALDPGDRVVLVAPYWVSYPVMVQLAGGEPVVVETRAADGYRVDPGALAEVLDERVRLVVLNSPANPTGVAYRAEELRAVAEEVDRRAPAAWIVTDDIYRKITYDGFTVPSLHRAAPGFDRVVSVDGVSKSHAMTGYRVGFLYAPADVVGAVSAIQGQTTSGAATPSQWGAVTALTDPACVPDLAEMVASFDRRRRLVLEGISGTPGLSVVPPEGAFYALVDASSLCGPGRPFVDDVTLASHLLESAGVAVVPGTPFGAPGTFRVSFAAADEVIAAGLAGIARAVAGV